MKLVKPDFEIIRQEEGILGVYKQIEIAGRTCYKSEDKITETSAEDFVNRMIKSGHSAILEHGTIYLYLPPRAPITFYKYRDNKYSTYREVRFSEETMPSVGTYVTTNLRVLVENNWLNDLEYLCEPTEYHVKRVTIKFICDRGVSHEFVRHRVFSFAQESTRYCNYSKNKFDGEITFIINPSWINTLEVVESLESMGICGDDCSEVLFKNQLYSAEQCYLSLLKEGWKPEQARAVLPNALKTELVMTGTVPQWEEFFKLRCDKNKVHPDAYYLAKSLSECLKEGW